MFKKFKCSNFFFGVIIIAVGMGVICASFLPSPWIMFFLSVLLILAGCMLLHR